MAASVLFFSPSAHCRCITTATTRSRGAPFSAVLLPRCRSRRRRSRCAALVARAAAVPPGHGLPRYETLGDAKAALYQALQGVDRGIFGITSAKRSEIHGLVELLESRNPTPDPTDKLQDKVDGCWKLIYSTISILGKRRTKLGLRDFISLGDFFQIIDVKEVSHVVHEILASSFCNFCRFLLVFSYLCRRYLGLHMFSSQYIFLHQA